MKAQTQTQTQTRTPLQRGAALFALPVPVIVRVIRK